MTLAWWAALGTAMLWLLAPRRSRNSASALDVAALAATLVLLGVHWAILPLPSALSSLSLAGRSSSAHLVRDAGGATEFLPLDRSSRSAHGDSLSHDALLNRGTSSIAGQKKPQGGRSSSSSLALTMMRDELPPPPPPPAKLISHDSSIKKAASSPASRFSGMGGLCPSASEPYKSGIEFIDRIVVLNLARHRERFDRVGGLLARHKLCAMRFEAVDGSMEFPETEEEAAMAIDPETGKRRKTILTPGEKGYRESMRQILQAQVSNGWKRTIVFDDDVMLHKSFRSLLEELINQSPNQCNSNVFAKGGKQLSGAYLLGSAEWGRWDEIDKEMAKSAELGLSSSCYSLKKKTFGSFAVIYSLTTAASILDWMNGSGKGSSAAPQVPFDHSFRAVQKEYQQPVMVATSPALAVMDDDAKYRAKKHRWDQAAYDRN